MPYSCSQAATWNEAQEGSKPGKCHFYHVRGFCSNGDACKFVHDEEEQVRLADADVWSNVYEVAGVHGTARP